MRTLHFIACVAVLLAQGSAAVFIEAPEYRLESRATAPYRLRSRFRDTQLALLEKLNRADVDHLERLPTLVLPVSWDVDELRVSPFPQTYPEAAGLPQLLLVHLAAQAFAAYEHGVLVRWGPVSSGRAASPTPAGSFALNWRSVGRSSTVNPDWFMRWYFNFGNEDGLAFHEYSLPGLPDSHGCVRLLTRDATWLYGWGRGWTLGPDEQVLTAGTPVLIVAPYDFDAAPPWRSLAWLAHRLELPALPDLPRRAATNTGKLDRQYDDKVMMALR